eukprot:TRINITY_DN4030_c0_g2_i2.p1 TRINITY_DN4030_c0_g2~~TRINITY_DN4030_c0_g2_i2.p1  ORF type:complete len:280 (+),score=46.01 TRINITY_DN4030_c0_g2_i2:211-1050(+)
MAHMSSHITFSQAGSSISNSLRTSFLPPSSPASKKNSDRATPKWTHLQPPRRRSPAPPVRAYADGPKQGAVMKFFRNLQGSLPLVGIVSRLVSAEGGVGSDRLRFAEFCRRVDKTLSPAAAEAFFKFQERHGKVARKQVVLLWCWAAAVGAGLVASDSILLGARRLRVSFDTEYEMDCLDSTMEESLKKREKANATPMEIPMEARAEKALEAICIGCVGKKLFPHEDMPILLEMLTGVFPEISRENMSSLIQGLTSVEEEEIDDSGEPLDLRTQAVGDS